MLELVIIDGNCRDPTFKDPETVKSPPTQASLVTVDVPTTCKVLSGFVFPIPSLPL